MSEQCLV